MQPQYNLGRNDSLRNSKTVEDNQSNDDQLMVQPNQRRTKKKRGQLSKKAFEKSKNSGQGVQESTSQDDI